MNRRNSDPDSLWLGSIMMGIRDSYMATDATPRPCSGRTAEPQTGVRLTLHIVLMPSPTGWTVSLEEQSPQIPVIPPLPPLRDLPPPTPPYRQPMSREPQPYIPGGTILSSHRRTHSMNNPREEQTARSAASSGTTSERRTRESRRSENRSTRHSGQQPERPERQAEARRPSIRHYYEFITPMRSPRPEPPPRRGGRSVRFRHPPQSSPSRTSDQPKRAHRHHK